ncbi:MAG: phosphatase PAP2 family protein [Candidatus Lokiarchaeota archaeon]|nr:phosphatase PAP2 family protein [Candidatus Lokiarchaeota archaeon]
MQRKSFFIALIVGLAFTAVMTLVFYFTDLDLVITGAFYEATVPHFPASEVMPWAWFNEQDKLLIIPVAAIVLLLIIAGASVKKLRPFLIYGLFMLFSYLIGPGLIVNLLFKGMFIGDFYIGWARPRPREITLFSGTKDFYKVWEPAFLNPANIDDNSSFPSGHVTVGAIFIVIFFAFNNVEFISRILGERTRGKIIVINMIKYAGLVVSIILGLLLALSRISSGAHFASDCMYSFVFTWLPTAVLYYWIFKIPDKEKQYLERLDSAAATSSK